MSPTFVVAHSFHIDLNMHKFSKYSDHLKQRFPFLWPGMLYPRLAWSEYFGNSTRVVYLCVYTDILCVNPETQVSVISFVILCCLFFDCKACRKQYIWYQTHEFFYFQHLSDEDSSPPRYRASLTIFLPKIIFLLYCCSLTC